MVRKYYSKYPLFVYLVKADAEDKVKELTRKNPEEIKKGVEYRIQTSTVKKPSGIGKRKEFMVYARHEVS